jgi:hypothetical protein
MAVLSLRERFDVEHAGSFKPELAAGISGDELFAFVPLASPSHERTANPQ